MALKARAGTDAGEGDGVGQRSADRAGGPVALEVRGVHKTFKIPSHRISRVKERLARPFARQEYRRLVALRDVSFDVHEGEFFGIVGRNGSGKSTLLKIMASIYGADAGRVRMAGRVAPFIELGVGFDMELSARENIVLNGVMMGMTPREARGLLDEVLEFAELEDFAEAKLKNYSSGMLVRLGFSVMIQADTDILLIDEVLAVGDAAFQQKCADVFHRMRDAGKTIVLVTHDMAAVEQYCHRAMLLDDGNLKEIGDPREIARRYLRLNFERGFQPAQGEVPASEEVRLHDVWLEDSGGERITNAEQGTVIRLRAAIEALRDLQEPKIGFVIADADDTYVHSFVATLPDGDRLPAGERITVTVELDNNLVPGSYSVHHGVGQVGTRGFVHLWVPHARAFVVFGDHKSLGLVVPEHKIEITQQDGKG